MFDQGKNTKEATRVISELYPEDAMTERTFKRWFAKPENATDLSRTSCALDALKTSITNL